ncbi:hypothetical protein HZA45_00775 [Candidatus Peregrinibacteria bacterium]|nr:hypothetical protein [Candidatus Peregrinibacteria bacterium]
MNTLKTFALRHDQLPAFHAGYLVLTILIASMLHLGAFAILIAAHMTLDSVKYREFHHYSWRKTVRAMVRESLVDITLLMLGILFAVYLHHSLPLIAGLSGLYRSEVTVVRALGMLIPRVKIFYDFLAILSNIHRYLNRVPTYLGKPWTAVEYVCALSLALMIVLLLLAPLVLSIETSRFLWILGSEMVPWRI